MKTHKRVEDLAIDTTFLKIGRRFLETKLFFAKKSKNFPNPLKKKKQNKKPNPIHFHNNCFYQTEISGKQTKQDV